MNSAIVGGGMGDHGRQNCNFLFMAFQSLFEFSVFIQ